jgi:hypothetical protein
VVAPGFGSLDDLRSACRGGVPPATDATLSLPSPGSLPANERRRATQVVRLTLSCIEQALAASPFPADALRAVFATDEGTGEVCQQMLEALATTGQISPLLFANSVLNAPSGYFSIGFKNRRSATVVSAGLESFASGLLCAASDAATARQPVLLVAYDPAMTAPIDELLPITEPTATAWVLSVNAAPSLPALATFALERAATDGAMASALPIWLPPRWAAHSSVRGLAALGLLEAEAAAVCHLKLGGMALALKRVQGPRP